MTCFSFFRGASPSLDTAAHHWNNFFPLFQWCLTRSCQDSSPLERLVFPLSGVPTPILTRQLTTGATCFSSFRGAYPNLDEAAHHWNDFFFLFPGYAPPPPRLRCRSAHYTPKHTFPIKYPRQKGAPPGALLSGKQLTIVLAAFTAVLQMSCRHLFLLPYLLLLRLSLLLWCQSPLLCQSEFLFRLLYRRISVSHLCMWLCR